MPNDTPFYSPLSTIFSLVVNTTADPVRKVTPKQSIICRSLVAEMVTFQKSITQTTLAVYTRQHLCELI